MQALRHQTIINYITDKLLSICQPVRVIALAMFCCASFAATADISHKTLLAQSTVTTDGVSTETQTPRVISRPQTAVVPTTDQAGLQTEDTAVGAAPAWHKYLRDYLSDEQLALLQDNLIWALLAAGALLLLPIILFSIISGRRERALPYDRYTPSAHAHDGTDSNQSAMKLGELDFDELDLTPTNATTKTDKNHHLRTQKVEQEATQSPAATEVEQPNIDSNDDTQLLNLQEPIDEKTGRETTASDEGVYPETLQTPPPAEHDYQNKFASSEADQASAQPSLANKNRMTVLTRFGKWLYELPPESGREAAIEGFMYWVSYSAGNIRPGLKQELAQAAELDDHGRIKRAVLSFQPEILHDIMLSLNKHLDQSQHQPFLDMMLAVLINGRGIKPVENLLLRFYADFTGIGISQLEDCYQQAYGKTLPGIPRPDRTKWWGQYKESTVADEGHGQSQQPWALLGLEENADTKTIERAQRLMEYRHHPNLFTSLGERERALVARSLHKYQAALDAVTEAAS